MIYLNAFLFAGLVCLIGQIILDNTTLTAGHITTIFVVVGAFLDVFSLYDKIVLWAGGGALVQNLDKLISMETGMPTYVAEDPLECVVRGTGKTLQDIDKLRTVLKNARKR